MNGKSTTTQQPMTHHDRKPPDTKAHSSREKFCSEILCKSQAWTWCLGAVFGILRVVMGRFNQHCCFGFHASGSWLLNFSGQRPLEQCPRGEWAPLGILWEQPAHRECSVQSSKETMPRASYPQNVHPIQQQISNPSHCTYFNHTKHVAPLLRSEAFNPLETRVGTCSDLLYGSSTRSGGWDPLEALWLQVRGLWDSGPTTNPEPCSLCSWVLCQRPLI